MKILELNSENVISEINNIISRQEECMVWGIPDNHYAFTGYQNNIINYNNIDKYNVRILNFPNEGGAIITSKGDLDLGHFSKDINNTFNIDVANKLETYLKNKNINAQFIGNDLIVDNKYKCGSFSSRRFKDLLYSAFHISINVNLQIIRDICIKPMSDNKIPKGLSDYGITTEEIKNLIINH